MNFQFYISKKNSDFKQFKALICHLSIDEVNFGIFYH